MHFSFEDVERQSANILRTDISHSFNESDNTANLKLQLSDYFNALLRSKHCGSLATFKVELQVLVKNERAKDSLTRTIISASEFEIDLLNICLCSFSL